MIGDESAFDSLRGPPSEGYRDHLEVGPLSALTFNRGRSASAARLPGQPGALRRARVRPRATAPGRGSPAPRRAPAAPRRRRLSLTEYSSPTIGELARAPTGPSDNFNAETLIKALGSEFGTAGTTRAGSVVVTRTMAGLRPEPAGGRRLRPLARQPHDAAPGGAAARAHGPDAGPAFETSLAVAGRNGTLFNRMRASVARDRCKAKTGTLTPSRRWPATARPRPARGSPSRS